jgi:hypothetical protein
VLFLAAAFGVERGFQFGVEAGDREIRGEHSAVLEIGLGIVEEVTGDW